ncbi:hypothetical protein M2387_001916 [Klebsiella sp. BIGb0407]|nr:hypothetical protein [Klebsiella sp. BIGb0407]
MEIIKRFFEDKDNNYKVAVKLRCCSKNAGLPGLLAENDNFRSK